jgi:hypothetical protein
MHFVATFQAFGTLAAKREILEEVRAQFKGRSWIRPMGETYIIRISSPAEHEEIRARLVAVARDRKDKGQKVWMLIGPPIESGSYNGFLPKDKWEKINKRTRP